MFYLEFGVPVRGLKKGRTGPNPRSEFRFGIQRKDLALHLFGGSEFGERKRPNPGLSGSD